jgi:hypothetical protein
MHDDKMICRARIVTTSKRVRRHETQTQSNSSYLNQETQTRNANFWRPTQYDADDEDDDDKRRREREESREERRKS